MPLSPSEAQNTLRDISTVSQASALSYGYRMAAPHFVMWGILWMIAWCASYFEPGQNLVWPIADVIGIAGSFYLGRRTASQGDSRSAGEGRRWAWRYAGSLLVIAAFIGSVFAIMPPRSDQQLSAFFPLLVALFYCLVGVWNNALRMLIIGAAVGALTLAGFFWLSQYYLLWMAIVGGGSLIFAGLWLRTA